MAVIEYLLTHLTPQPHFGQRGIFVTPLYIRQSQSFPGHYSETVHDSSFIFSGQIYLMGDLYTVRLSWLAAFQSILTVHGTCALSGYLDLQPFRAYWPTMGPVHCLAILTSNLSEHINLPWDLCTVSLSWLTAFTTYRPTMGPVHCLAILTYSLSQHINLPWDLCTAWLSWLAAFQTISTYHGTCALSGYLDLQPLRAYRPTMGPVHSGVLLTLTLWQLPWKCCPAIAAETINNNCFIFSRRFNVTWDLCNVESFWMFDLCIWNYNLWLKFFCPNLVWASTQKLHMATVSYFQGRSILYDTFALSGYFDPLIISYRSLHVPSLN